MNKLVSIVSPVYNGESYIGRYFDAILAQTYKPLELILVNDGSKDRTDEIVSEYKGKLEAAGISFKYIVRENAGVGAAINDGLKETTGDFLIWPDTDDVLLPDSIEKRVAFLENNPGYGFVYSNGAAYGNNDLETRLSEGKNNIPANGDIYENVVKGDIDYNPCGYMLKMACFLDVNPTKSIFPSRYGQNIQMLLPISKKYKCGYLKEVLFKRIDRAESLSKQVWTENDMAWQNRVLGLSEIYEKTLLSCGYDSFPYIPYTKYRDLRILTAITKSKDKNLYKKYRKMLLESTGLMISETFKTLFNLLTNRW